MGEVAGEAAVASEALHQVVCVAEADLHPRPEHGLGEPLEAAVLLLVSAANRLISEVVQSRRRPLLGPSPG